MSQSHVDVLKKLYGGPMDARQVELLRDIQAFLDFCIENGLSFQLAVGTLAHDVNGILSPDGYFDRGIFSPKVSGYAEGNARRAEIAADMEKDPSMQRDSAYQE